MATLNQIRDEVYYLINQRHNSQVYDFNTRVLPKINRVQTQICKGFYVSVLNWQKYKAWDLRFLRKKIYFNSVSNIVTSANVSAGAATIPLAPTTNLPNFWFLYCNWIVIQYTWKTLNSVTGVTWLIVPLQSWQPIMQAIQIPNDADRTFQLFQIIEWGYELEVPYTDMTHQTNKYFSFKIVEDQTTINNFVIVQWRRSDNGFLLYYYAKSQDLVNLSDTSTIPDPYALEVLSKIIAWELLRETEQDPQSERLLTLWYSKLEWMYNSFNDFHQPDRMDVVLPTHRRYY